MSEHETRPRWQTFGLDPDPPLFNPYLICSNDMRAADDGSCPEHAGPPLAST